MQVFGDEQLSQEVVAFLQQWDHAICSLEIQDIIQLCRPDIRLVDVSTEIKGIDAYQALWLQYRPFIPEGIRIERQDVNFPVGLVPGQYVSQQAAGTMAIVASTYLSTGTARNP